MEVVVEEIGERGVVVEVSSSIGCGVVCLIDDFWVCISLFILELNDF